MNDTQALTRRATASIVAPQTYQEARAFAEQIADTDFVPVAMRGKPGAVLAAIQFGAELGIGPMQALRNINVIEGKVGFSGDLMLGLAKGTGELDQYEEHFLFGKGSKCPYCGRVDKDHAEWSGQELEALILIQRRARTLRRYTFNLADANRVDAKERGEWIKLSQKAMYRQWPQRMYVMRARCFALRTEFADLYAGVYTPEELQDATGPDVEVIDTTTATDTAADSPWAHLSEELQQTLTTAFDTCHFPPALRRVKLNEYKGREDELLAYLRQEYAARQNKKLARKADPQAAATTEPSAESAAAAATTSTVVDAPVLAAVLHVFVEAKETERAEDRHNWYRGTDAPVTEYGRFWNEQIEKARAALDASPVCAQTQEPAP